MMSHVRPALLLLVTLAVAGCGTTRVAVQDSGFPRPLVDRLPMHVGLHFAEGFTEHEHDEKLQDHGRWTISIGPAQAALFQRVLPAMFNGVELVDSIDTHGRLDAVLSISVEDFQSSDPEQLL
jgi:hypothetical protein